MARRSRPLKLGAAFSSSIPSNPACRFTHLADRNPSPAVRGDEGPKLGETGPYNAF